MADLRDFLQSMSNSAASNVSAPVDGINWLLGKAGLPVSSAPFMGSDWMAQKGLTRPVKLGAASVLGETAGMLAPMAIAAKAPQIARGLLQAEANAMAPRTMNPQTGAIVWHGSPYKFDKFDSSKIGTGEGAQAYGHGLYLAESADVAKQYADNVKDMGAVTRINAELSDLAKRMNADEIPGAYRKYRTDAGRQAAQRYDELMSAKEGVRTAPGSMYKVDLPDEHIAKMLDWDKPLSQQHPDVQKAISKYATANVPSEGLDMGGGRILANHNGQAKPDSFSPWVLKAGDSLFDISQKDMDRMLLADKGEAAYTRMTAALGAQGKASDALRQAGIPGIRYLDGGSRGTGAGTSNFVVFPGNEDILKIMERNGKGLLAD